MLADMAPTECPLCVFMLANGGDFIFVQSTKRDAIWRLRASGSVGCCQATIAGP